MMNEVSDQRRKLCVPAWIHEADVPMRDVHFPDAVQTKLHLLATSKRLKFCASKEDIMMLITQVLRQDIRSVYQGRGSKDEGPIGSYECTLDSVVVQFSTHKEYIQIDAVELKSKVRDKQNNSDVSQSI